MPDNGYTAGDIKNGQFLAEDTFGTIKTSAMSYFGAPTGMFKPLFNPDPTELFLPDAQTFGAVVDGVEQAGFTGRFTARKVDGAYDWTDFWALYGFGAADGLANHLPFFTGSLDVHNGTTHQYHVFNGCKMNKLAIIGEGLGKPIIFEPEVWSQHFQLSVLKTLSNNMQDVVMGADGAAPSSDTLTWKGNSQINLGGGGLNTWYLKNYKLTHEPTLTRVEGSKTGDDAEEYSVAVSLDEGQRNIMLECQIVNNSQTYVNAKINRTAITALTIPMGAKTITLENGYFPGGDLPEYKPELNVENIRMKFPTLSIS